MKYSVFFLLIVMLVLYSISGFTESNGMDLTTWSFQELMEMKTRIDAELFSRPEANALRLPMGDYLVGRDLQPGRYNLCCVDPSKYGDAHVEVYETKDKEKTITDIYVRVEGPNYSISIDNGNLLEVTNGGIALKVSSFRSDEMFQFEPLNGTYVPCGAYTIGNDIPAGSFEISAAKNSGGRVLVYYTKEKFSADDNLYRKYDYDIDIRANQRMTAKFDIGNVIYVKSEVIFAQKNVLQFEGYSATENGGATDELSSENVRLKNRIDELEAQIKQYENEKSISEQDVHKQTNEETGKKQIDENESSADKSWSILKDYKFQIGEDSFHYGFVLENRMADNAIIEGNAVFNDANDGIIGVATIRKTVIGAGESAFFDVVANADFDHVTVNPTLRIPNKSFAITSQMAYETERVDNQIILTVHNNSIYNADSAGYYALLFDANENIVGYYDGSLGKIKAGGTTFKEIPPSYGRRREFDHYTIYIYGLHH